MEGVSYPASREALVIEAEQNCVPEELLRGLRSPPDEEYPGPEQLVNALRRG